MNDLKQSFDNVYGFKKGNLGVIHTPEMVLPESVIERIVFFRKYADDGMTFRSCLELIRAEDEEKCKEEFGFGAYEDWLEVSDEFKKWYNENRLADMELSVALIYGMGEEIEKRLEEKTNG